MPLRIRLALAQINPAVGDLAGNAAKIAEFAARAAALKPDVLVFPELALTGYPPEDLVMRSHFVKDSAASLRRLAAKLPAGVATIVGFVDGRQPKGVQNAAAVLFGGKVRAVYHKQRLPNYGVFDEVRYFTPGAKTVLIGLRGVAAGITICEDIWSPGGPALESARRGAGLILNLSASPYHAGKLSVRLAVIRRGVRECRVPFAYCNLVGGQDELVFDGGSLVLDGRGRVVAEAAQFDETILAADLEIAAPKRLPKGTLVCPVPAGERPPLVSAKAATLAPEAEVYNALVLGTRDYIRKNGFQKAVIGLSGGIDSSLVACVAADALGRENVVGVTLPSKFNTAETRSDAEVLARNLGLAFHQVPIQGVVDEFLKALAPLFAGRKPDLAEENLQARVRGTLLMALSNKFNWIVLTTGNKSETSVGYSTLYGDTAGGFAVIKDIPKTLVYRLCEWRNKEAGRDLIPRSVFDRPPTAELRENQKDQDSLPPYDLLDRVIKLYVEEDKGLDEVLRAGIDPAVAKKVLRLVDVSEYKRRQGPPGVKITPKAFGRDRRMPITNRYRAGEIEPK